MGNKKAEAARLPIVDGLRAIAITAVVLFHTFPSTIPGGFIGVDIFFVISGFVIALRYLPSFVAGDASIRDFFLRRIRRLVPAYFVLIVVVSLIAYAILVPRDLYSYGQSLAAQAIYAQNVVFWYQGDYFEPAQVKPLLHTWSLAIEEQFYLLFPFVVVLFRRRPSYAIAAIVLVCAFSLGLGYVLATTTPKTAFFLLPTRIWQFVAGVAAAMLFAHAPVQRALRWPVVATSLFLLAVVTLAVSIFAFDETAGFPSAQAALAVAATVVICVVQSAILPAAGAPFRTSVVQHLGRISYSWYLWHWPITVFFFATQRRMPDFAEGLVCLGAGYLLGALSYRYVEHTSQRAKWFASPRGATCLLLTFLVFSAAAGAYLVASRGALHRYPEGLRLLYAGQMDRAPYRCTYLRRLRMYDAEICNINGLRGDGAVLLLGDSHADQVKGLLATMGEASRKPVYLTKRNCKIIDYGKSDFCSEAVWADLRRDIDRFGVTDVIAVSYWPETATPADYVAAARRVVASGVTLHVERPLPTGEFFDPGARLSGRGADSRTYGLEDYYRQNSRQNAGMATLAALPGVRMLDPVPYLCGSGTCIFSTAGRPHYSDTHHLTPVGVERLEAMYEPIFSSDRRRRGAPR